MLTRRLLPLVALPGLLTSPRTPLSATVATPAPAPRNCGDPGGSFIACEALQDMLPLATATRCPLCGGMHRLVGGR